MKRTKIAFIGAGNMTQAIVTGLLQNNYAKDNIYIANRSKEKLTQFPTHVSTDNVAMAQHADVIVLAVKPKQIAKVCQQIQTVCQQTKPIVVSLAIGISLEYIAQQLNYQGAIIRAMPNTPCAIGYGATGLIANSVATETQRNCVAAIFDYIGKTVWLDNEDLLTSVAAVSGSGPAYLFLMMQAMQQAAEKLGLTTDVAAELVSQTVIGAGMLAQQNHHQFATLRQQVTSPNGSTQAAIESFEANNFIEIIAQAMQAAVKRSQQIKAESELQ